jgi:NAD(P)-dependent dehydrogenase (short-subunit alcohol dehydrogenase family)
VTAYAGATAAFFRLTGTLAAETAGHGITVLFLSPGWYGPGWWRRRCWGRPGG